MSADAPIVSADDRLLIVEVDPEPYRERIARRHPDLTIDTRRASDADLAEALERATLLLAWSFPSEAARNARRLRWIQSTAAGVDHLLRIPHLAKDVPITRVGEGFGPAMAEYVLGYLLALALRIPRVVDQQRKREWKPFATPLLRGKVALVIGLGAIGAEAARLLRAAGLRVLGVSRSGRPSPAVDETWSVERLHEVLPRAEIVVLTVARVLNLLLPAGAGSGHRPLPAPAGTEN